MTDPTPPAVREIAPLLPCPFCSNMPETFPSGDGTGEMIQCFTEGCVGPHTSYYGAGVARRKWNQRAQSSLALQVKRLEEERDQYRGDLDAMAKHANALSDKKRASEAEVARLRAALTAILVDCEAQSKPDFSARDCRQRCAIVARAALAQSPEGKP